MLGCLSVQFVCPLFAHTASTAEDQLVVLLVTLDERDFWLALGT